MHDHAGGEGSRLKSSGSSDRDFLASLLTFCSAHLGPQTRQKVIDALEAEAQQAAQRVAFEADRLSAADAAKAQGSPPPNHTSQTACEENAEALLAVKHALDTLHRRTRDRIKHGVAGTKRPLPATGQPEGRAWLG